DLAFVSHALAIVVSVMVLSWSISYRGGFAWESTNKSLIFNLHPVLMLIGFVILGGETIISYKSLPFERQVKKKIHFALHLIALILGIFGIITAAKNHNELNIPNFYSLHSWIGFVVICLYISQLKYSYVIFFYHRVTEAERSHMLPLHVSTGLFIFVLAIGNSALGFVEKVTLMENSGLDRYGSEAFLVNIMALITIIFGLFVVLTVFAKTPPSSDEDNDSYSATRSALLAC
ncbi:unnamed protein product, partial [Thlaspi arvense]